MSNILTILFQYILPFVIVISVIIFVHELGHFLTAKKFGVYCGEFSIGMGPLLWKKQVGETQYSLRAIPIGGFVSMAGEVDDTMKDVEVPYERTINGISAGKRIIVMLAGIIMNILLAWVIYIGINMSVGVVPVEGHPVFNQIAEGSAAEMAGLEAGDIVISIEKEDGKVVEINSSTQLSDEIGLYHETLIYTVERDGELLKISAAPTLQEDGTYFLGVTIQSETRKIKWYESFYYGTKDMLNNSTLILKSFVTLFQGKNWDQVSGPIGIVQIVGEATQYGMLSFLNLLALLSLNIGIFNAIPIPALDGGRALITTFELITGKSVNTKLLENLIIGGFIFLLGLMLFVTFNDVLKLIF